MVTKRISGRDFEERLRTRLGVWCDIAYDANMEHQYKVNFTITRFRDTFFTAPIGVQVTVKDDDVRKQSEFLRIHRQGRIIPKSVFIEVSPSADLDSAATVAYIALGNLTFSKEFQGQDIKIIGIRIESDSYEFFELEDNARNLRMDQMTQATVRRDDRLAGEVIWYNAERGYGSIYCPSRAEEFYLHIYKTEGDLRSILQNIDNTGYCDPPVPVNFVDGGYKEGHSKPQAQYIRAGSSTSQPATPQPAYSTQYSTQQPYHAPQPVYQPPAPPAPPTPPGSPYATPYGNY